MTEEDVGHKGAAFGCLNPTSEAGETLSLAKGDVEKLASIRESVTG